MIKSLCGWAGEDAAAKAWDVFGDSFQKPLIVGAQANSFAGRTFRVWDYVKSVNTVSQETGDCVAVSSADVCNMIAQLEIELGDQEEYHRIFPPFIYAASRVIVGKNQLQGGAGSVGSWMAKALETIGVIPEDTPGLPRYSGQLADSWGDDRGNWRQYLPLAKDHTFQATFLENWDQLVDFVCRGYLCTIASSLGFVEQPDSNGFHRQRGVWNHSMGIWGVCDDRRKPWCGIHNQWGPRHGNLVDFETGERWPTGMLRVHPEEIERAFTHGEVIAYSNFKGFVDRDPASKWSV